MIAEFDADWNSDSDSLLAGEILPERLDSSAFEQGASLSTDMAS